MVMSFSSYAKSVGKSRQYIHKLYTQGRLNEAIVNNNKNGVIMLDKMIADRLTGFHSEDDSMENKNNTDEYEEFKSLSFDQSRHMKTFYEAKQEKVKYEKEVEKLVPANEVEKDAFNAALILRDNLFSIPAQVAPILSSMTSIFEIKNTLNEFIRKVLQKMCLENLIFNEKDE